MANAAISAKQIKTDYPASPTGTYWMDPDLAGPIAPFQAWADEVVLGGGWSLAISSVTGSEAPTSDIVSNTGAAPVPSLGHTRNFSPLAVTGLAEIRHEITFAGGAKFHAKYTGMFHDPMPVFSAWTTLFGHTPGTEANLAANFGQPWQPVTAFGAPWYTPGGAMLGVLPSTPVNGLTGGPFSTGNSVTSYQVWIREVVTPFHTIPEPSSLVLASLGACSLAVVALRRRRRSAA
ncbi:MAG: PEP-CTERM sorting domain-containing protein [Pirellulales bacterium]|nr:PEP-CTERM sorting domain-containing protein [Pirellulales bacterium]